MGQIHSVGSFGLTQVDVEELIEFCNGAFTQEEIESLYKRFRSLDRGRKGFLTADEFNSIPELSINPLAKRVGSLYDNINFKEFVGMLAPYSPKASREDKLRHMFLVYDVDGDGIISEQDMELILRQLAGSSLNDEEMSIIVRKVMAAAGGGGGGGGGGLTFEAYSAALEGHEIHLHVDIPLIDDN